MRRRPARSRPSAAQLVGPLEYQCLSVLWRLGSASVSTVRAELNSEVGRPQLAYTTVMTTLSRLQGKGILTRMKQGRGYVYAARLSEEELVARLSRREIDELLSRYGNVAVAQFTSAVREASPRELALLRELLADDQEPDD